MSAHISNVRPRPDKVLVDIANYVGKYTVKSAEAYNTARFCLMDTLGCGFEALEYPACTKLMGPVVPGTVVPNGAKVPGTSFQLDPVKAAFDIGAMIRWLDFNDTWLAAEWGHPSDNLGGILATADWLSRTAVANGKKPLVMRDVLTAMIKAHEIQGVLALENTFNRVGLDHVVLVKVASTAVVAQMLGLTHEETINAVSQAWVDGQSLRTYRHAPNTGSRKSWAAGDATSRAVRLALIAKTGEMGYPSVLSRQGLGLLRRAVQGQARSSSSARTARYVMEHVLFKISFPAEFHSQTAVECAMTMQRRVGEARQEARGHQEDHHPHPRGLHPHHRQEGPAEQPGRPRPLHPVHGRRADHLRPPHRGRLRGRRSPPIRASTSCATRSSASRTRVHEGLPRPGQALDRQRPHRRVQGREEAEGDRVRVPDRPQAPPQGRHPGAGGEVHAPTSRASSRRSSRTRSTRCASTRRSWRRHRSTSSSI